MLLCPISSYKLTATRCPLKRRKSVYSDSKPAKTQFVPTNLLKALNPNYILKGQAQLSIQQYRMNRTRANSHADLLRNKAITTLSIRGDEKRSIWSRNLSKNVSASPKTRLSEKRTQRDRISHFWYYIHFDITIPFQ